MKIKRLDTSASSSTTLQPLSLFSLTLGMTIEGQRRSRVRGWTRQRAQKCSSRHRHDAHARWARKLELTKFNNPKLVEIEPAMHRLTRWASGASCLSRKRRRHCRSACAPTAPNSSRGGPDEDKTDSATCRPCGHHRRAAGRTLLK